MLPALANCLHLTEAEPKRKDGNLDNIVPHQLFVVCQWLKEKTFERKNISSGIRSGLPGYILAAFVYSESLSQVCKLVTATPVPLFSTLEHRYIQNP